MENFTPWSSLAGGALIGLAAAVLWVGDGRIAGISGILGGLANASGNDIGWRVMFLAGLIAAPLLYALAVGIPVVSSLCWRGWRHSFSWNALYSSGRIMASAATPPA